MVFIIHSARRRRVVHNQIFSDIPRYNQSWEQIFQRIEWEN